jgi:YihY family inner membrane protein
MFKWLYGPILFSKADRLGTYAAALAYCFVLSLIPFLVVTFTVISQVAPGKLDLGGAYKDLLTDILPSLDVDETPHPRPMKDQGDSRASPNSSDSVNHLKAARVANLSAQIALTLQSTSQRGLATIGFILAVYTSFNLMMQIVRTLHFIFDDPRRPQEWNWTVVLKTIALLLIWMFLLLLISSVSVMTPVIEKILSQFHLEPRLWASPLLVARDIVLLTSLFGAFFLTYYLVPGKRWQLSQIRNGSLVASCGWVLCSLLFAHVLPSMWHMNAVYEALGSVVVILLWAQACAWCVIVGACWIVRFSPRGK